MFYILVMHKVNVSNIDLNLLKALYALLESGSVTKAAEHANLSQPAMSRALNRLQQVIKDPLLVRSGRGMVLTPRGNALRVPVRDALMSVSHVFQPGTFDPAQANDHFRIMAPDYVAQLVMPPVLAQIFKMAPGVEIEMENLSAAGVKDMCEGKLSLGFGVIDDGPALYNVAAQSLFEDRQVCLMRKGHPLLDEGLTLENFATTPHAMLSITGRGGGRIDDVLRDHGLKRTIALRITQFMTIDAVIAPTDLIITVPERLANQVMTDALQMSALPEELQAPPFAVSQIWHERYTNDPAHQWLRRMIKTACKNLR